MSHTYMYILYHPLFKTFIQNYHFHYICISYSKQKDSLQNGRCHVEDPGQLYYYYILFPLLICKVKIGPTSILIAILFSSNQSPSI